MEKNRDLLRTGTIMLVLLSGSFLAVYGISKISGGGVTGAAGLGSVYGGDSTLAVVAVLILFVAIITIGKLND